MKTKVLVGLYETKKLIVVTDLPTKPAWLLLERLRFGFHNR